MTRASWFRTALALLAAVLLQTAPLLAKGELDWPPLTDADWGDPADAGRPMDAVVLRESVLIDHSDLVKDLCVYSCTTRVRILSPAGRARGNVELPWFHEDQKVAAIEGRTVLRDGTVLPLDPDRVETVLKAKQGGHRYRTTLAHLPGVTDDCVIDLVYTLRLPVPVQRWMVSREDSLASASLTWRFFRGRGVAQAWYANHVEDWQPNYSWLNFDRPPAVRTQPEDWPMETVFEVVGMPARVRLPWSLPDDGLQAVVYLYYSDAASYPAWWVDRSREEAKRLEEFDFNSNRLRRLADSLRTALPEDAGADRIADAAFLSLRERVRCEFDLDEDEKLPGNDCPNDVLRRGKASATDFARTLRLLNEELGLKSRLAWACDRSRSVFHPQAKFRQFSYSLVRTEVEPGRWRSDMPGRSWLGPRELPWWIEGGKLFLVGEDDPIVPAGRSETGANRESSQLQVRLDDGFELESSYAERHVGQSAMRVRQTLARKDSLERARLLAERFETLFPRAGNSQPREWRGVDAPGEPLVLRTDFECSLPWAELGEARLVRVGDLLPVPDHRLLDAEREQPVLLRHAGERRVSVQLELPAGWRAEALPEARQFTNDCGAVALSGMVVDEGQRISIQWLDRLDSPYLPESSYGELRALQRERESLLDGWIRLEPATKER